MRLESRIEKLEQQAGAKDDLLIFVIISTDDGSGIRPTEEELQQLKKDAVEKNPGQMAYVIRWKPATRQGDIHKRPQEAYNGV